MGEHIAHTDLANRWRLVKLAETEAELKALLGTPTREVVPGTSDRLSVNITPHLGRSGIAPANLGIVQVPLADGEGADEWHLSSTPPPVASAQYVVVSVHSDGRVRRLVNWRVDLDAPPLD
jgi:hypothetical protein